MSVHFFCLKFPIHFLKIEVLYRSCTWILGSVSRDNIPSELAEQQKKKLRHQLDTVQNRKQFLKII